MIFEYFIKVFSPIKGKAKHAPYLKKRTGILASEVLYANNAKLKMNFSHTHFSSDDSFNWKVYDYTLARDLE